MRLSKKCGGISLTAKITEDSIKRNHDREKYKTTLGEKMKFKKKNKNQKFSFLFFFYILFINVAAQKWSGLVVHYWNEREEKENNAIHIILKIGRIIE